MGELASIEISTTMLQTVRGARFVRIHPVCWHGPTMSMRTELLSCASPFDWTFMRQQPTTDCGKIMSRARPSFLKWTDGKDGSGVAFQTDGKDISVNGVTQTFRAYQKRVIRGKGLLIKQLICFDPKTGSKKAARPSFSSSTGGWTDKLGEGVQSK